MLVDERPGDPGGARDRLDRDLAEPALGDQLGGRVEELLAASGARHALRFRLRGRPFEFNSSGGDISVTLRYGSDEGVTGSGEGGWRLEGTIAARRRAETGGEVIKKSRFVVSIGAAVALGIGSSRSPMESARTPRSSMATSSRRSSTRRSGSRSPCSPGVRTEVAGGVNGLQANPTTEYISYGKNIKFDFNAGSVCTTLPPSGSTPEQARAACPEDSYLGRASPWSRAPASG